MPEPLFLCPLSPQAYVANLQEELDEARAERYGALAAARAHATEVLHLRAEAQRGLVLSAQGGYEWSCRRSVCVLARVSQVILVGRGRKLHHRAPLARNWQVTHCSSYQDITQHEQPPPLTSQVASWTGLCAGAPCPWTPRAPTPPAAPATAPSAWLPSSLLP